jgi:hypothetical protein
VPHGAAIIDPASGKAFPGKTPMTFQVAGSKTPRVFVIKLAGYSDALVEIAPTELKIEHIEKLERGAAGTQVKHVIDVKAGSGSAVTRPETGSAARPPETGSAARPPETGSAARPPETGSAARPPETGSAAKPPDDDCEMPCTKKVVPGLHGSGGAATTGGAAGSGTP